MKELYIMAQYITNYLSAKNTNYGYIADIVAAKHLALGSDTSVNEWIKSYNQVSSLTKEPCSLLAKELLTAITQIRETYGIKIATQIFNAVDPIFEVEMVNAAKYLSIGGALEHLSVLANAGLFMPGVLDYLPKETLQDIINHMKSGGVIEDVFELSVEIKERPPDKKQKGIPEMDI